MYLTNKKTQNKTKQKTSERYTSNHAMGCCLPSSLQHTDLLRAELANQPQLMEQCIEKKRGAPGRRDPGSSGERRGIREADLEAPRDCPPFGAEQVQEWREGVEHLR